MPSDLLIRQCVSLAEMDDGWLDACTVLARRYEREGTSLLTQLIGLTMQEDLYALSGLTAEVRDAELRRSELESLLDRVDANYQLVQALDPQVYARYLDVWATSGERAALEFGLDATEQLLADPDYDPCVYMPSE